MARENVVQIDRNWWKEDREPMDASHLVVKRKRKIPSVTYTIEQLRQKFKISNDVLYKAIRNGELNAFPFGRIYRIAEDDLLEYFEHQAKKKGIA